jgi:hypothetical protein
MHRCCICHEPRKHVQIHHIDGNPSNNEWENLAVLCVDCHSLVTGDQGFGKKYSEREVKLYKSNWEQQCDIFHQQEESNEAEDDEEVEDEGNEEPADSYYTDTILPADSHISRDYKLDEGDLIQVWVESDEPLDVMLMKPRQYNLWSQNPKDENIKFIEYEEDQYELSASYLAPKNGNYTLVICNFTNEDADVQLDISIWE